MSETAADASAAAGERSRGARPKTRTRSQGAAVPLEDLDRKLLNLMQGSFPVAARPYGHVAALAGISETEVMERVQLLLRQRIIRQVTPIFDTRALGTCLEVDGAARDLAIQIHDFAGNDKRGM